MQVGNKIIFDDKETTIVNVWAMGKHRKYLLADGREIMVEPGQEHTLIDSGRVRIVTQNSPLKVPANETVPFKKSEPQAPAPKPPSAKPAPNVDSVRKPFNWGGDQNEHD